MIDTRLEVGCKILDPDDLYRRLIKIAHVTVIVRSTEYFVDLKIY